MIFKALLPSFKGQQAEEVAKRYLISQGLQWITSNFHSRMGEIDLIMQDKDYLVFIEVRYRKGKTHGTGIGTVDLAKQKRLGRTALFYLQKNHLIDKVPCRFDIIEVNQDFTLAWLKDAFTYDYTC